MPNDRNNYLQSAHYLLEDRKGYYWISSNNGLFKVPKKQLFSMPQMAKLRFIIIVSPNGMVF
jgi:ligand-binding sensor domain-containing protein